MKFSFYSVGSLAVSAIAFLYLSVGSKKNGTEASSSSPKSRPLVGGASSASYAEGNQISDVEVFAAQMNDVQSREFVSAEDALKDFAQGAEERVLVSKVASDALGE